MQVTSIRKVLEDGAAVLAGAGVAEARRESLVLWASVMKCSPGQVWLQRAVGAETALVGRFREAVERRAQGIPAAYAAGTAAFRTLELKVDPRVLIPRPETEGIVDHVLAHFAVLPYYRSLVSSDGVPGKERSWGVAADVGTGSGCIALSLAVEGKFERVIATDASEGALEAAKENARQLGAGVEFRLGDLVSPLAGETVDVLVSNPPYVTDAEWEALDAAVKDHEPRDALVSGADGLRATRALIEGARDIVCPGGLLAIEIDCRRAGAVLELARDAGWSTARIAHDPFDRPRYLLAIRGTA